MRNPLDGIVPNFAIFGLQFTQLWQKIFAGVWGIAIVIVIFFLIQGIVKVGQSGDTNPQGVAAGKQQMVFSGLALGGLVALAVIVGAIIAVFGS